MTSKKNKDLPSEFMTVLWIARIYGASWSRCFFT
jgi:hypothetical protein